METRFVLIIFIFQVIKKTSALALSASLEVLSASLLIIPIQAEALPERGYMLSGDSQFRHPNRVVSLNLISRLRLVIIDSHISLSVDKDCSSFFWEQDIRLVCQIFLKTEIVFRKPVPDCWQWVRIHRVTIRDKKIGRASCRERV